MRRWLLATGCWPSSASGAVSALAERSPAAEVMGMAQHARLLRAASGQQPTANGELSGQWRILHSRRARRSFSEGALRFPEVR